MLDGRWSATIALSQGREIRLVQSDDDVLLTTPANVTRLNQHDMRILADHLHEAARRVPPSAG